MTTSVAQLTKKWAEHSKLNLHFENEMTSTNDFAKNISSANNEIHLVLANHQTHGRGRNQNTWQDNQGDQLLCSWVFDLQSLPMPTTTCRAGLAVIHALKATWPWLEISLKAPNDIYLKQKKLGGILLENIQQGKTNRLIIGIGLNVFNQPKLEIATSLATQMQNNPIDESTWEKFLDRLLLELTFAISSSNETLSLNDRSALLFYLNLNPNLNETYISIDENGSLKTQNKSISWLEL